MTLQIRPFELEHFHDLAARGHMRPWQSMLSGDDWRLLAARGEAWSGFVGDVCVGCAGIVDHGEGRGEAWAMLPDDAGPHMAAITRAVMRGLRTTPLRRVQAITACTFAPGRKWAKMLGFRFEGTLRAYCADGSDAEIWARVR